MSVLPGYSGHLIAQSFLAARIASLRDDAIERARSVIAGSQATARSRLGPASSARAIFEESVIPIVTALGFDPPADEDTTHAAVAATIRASGCAVVVLVTPWCDRLDGYWRTAVHEARRRRADWCLVFNGASMRIVDAARVYARRHVEFDVNVAADHADGFAAMWQLACASTLCAERADPRSLHALVIESDRHATGVCRSLRDGVLTASRDILQALVTRSRTHRTPSVEESFDQALTIVYRIVFLLFAEARALVPVWHPVYRESYSVESLRETAERSPAAPGLWDALRAIARLAHAGCRAGDLRVTPFNGRLFAPGRTPLAERRDLDDDAARGAVLALSTRTAVDRAGRERIVYRDLGVEQLGAVYETLLDYQPRIEHAAAERGRRRPPHVTLEAGSGVRKATGTFYTPQPIAEHLVRRTLAPLVRDAQPDAILNLRIVDPAMGSGAFLVAACRYLASAYEQALVAAGTCHPGDIDEAERTRIRRMVAERCLYGVDVNPMAVQLARLSLWLTTLAADRPLSFLDHRLVAGDSLLGAWLSDLRRPPGRHRQSQSRMPSLFPEDIGADAIKGAVPVRFTLEATPNDTVEQVRTKERALAALDARDSTLSRWRRIADLWCAFWFAPSTRFARSGQAPSTRSGQPPSTRDALPPQAFGSLVDAILSGDSALPARIRDAYLQTSDAIATARRFFHWELEFPEVFFDATGRRLDAPGFDAVIGNPPWDMMRADAGTAAARDHGRADTAAAVRFTRESGAYGAQSDGHANCYQLFVERAIALTRRGGRLGLVLPSGLALDHGSAALRRHLFARCDVDALVGVDNQRAIFPIHRSVRFLLVSGTAGSATRRMACRLGVASTAELESLGDDAEDTTGFPVQVTPAALQRVSGDSLAVPHFRAAIDLSICEKAASLFAPLGSDTGWSARFGRELNATDDRGAFRAAGRGLPIVDGRHLAPFRVDLAASERSIAAADALRRLGADRFDRARLAYRDVASATNRVTLIAALLPAGCVSTHTVFCLRTPLPLARQHFLCGLFNSFVVNYLVRLRVSTHVTTAVVEQLPVPSPDAAPALCREIAALARLLANRADDAAFARLNARVAALYQLTPGEFDHVVSTFPLVPQPCRDAALRAFGEL